MTLAAMFLVPAGLLGLVLYLLLRSRNAHLWIGGYCVQLLKTALTRRPEGPVHVMFCFVDHYEPKWRDPGREVERKRVATWVREYPILADRHRDCDGKAPQHTWFYPAEEFEDEHLENLNSLCRRGYGEIELHLHHHDDTSAGLRAKLLKAFEEFGRHGLFQTRDKPEAVSYAFIHGNWALDNSHARGIQCGVNDELIILRDTGCYADFTLPSAPSSCQTGKINSIYYATDDPDRPKSHDSGTDTSVGMTERGDLLIVQGPLCLRWRSRKWGFLPGIENGAVSGNDPATPERVDLWVRRNIHVKGRENWIFVKVHCHGTQEGDWPALLGAEADALYDCLESRYNDGTKYKLHYVTARECYNIIQAAIDGREGTPDEYRDYKIGRYRGSSQC